MFTNKIIFKYTQLLIYYYNIYKKMIETNTNNKMSIKLFINLSNNLNSY